MISLASDQRARHSEYNNVNATQIRVRMQKLEKVKVQG